METAKQIEFIQSALAGENIFLTGKAGTGKSFIVKRLLQLFEDQGKKVVVAAPTGIAAINIDGQTLHSLFSLKPFGVLDYQSCNFINKGKREVLRAFEVLIIDEVSMLRPDVLDALHYTLRKNGLKGLDRRQIILVGDMRQLPPVLSDNLRSVLLGKYEGTTWLSADIMERLNLRTIELDEVQRQTDLDFIHALNVIREGGKHQYFRQFVHTEPLGVVLAPHNSTVAKYNDDGLAKQDGEMITFEANMDGDVKPIDFTMEQIIKVKNGCRIMYLRNSQDNNLRNGTLGTFVHRQTEKGPLYFIKVGNVEYSLKRVCVVKKEYVYDKAKDKLVMRELGSMTQYPFKLAYALSIHKSQGLTFDEMTLDLRQPCFEPEQMYVALSRARNPEGLRIIINQ